MQKQLRDDSDEMVGNNAYASEPSLLDYTETVRRFRGDSGNFIPIFNCPVQCMLRMTRSQEQALGGARVREVQVDQFRQRCRFRRVRQVFARGDRTFVTGALGDRGDRLGGVARERPASASDGKHK
eukprot:3905810-Pleurochrysis_carterae.AAC.1